MAGGVAWSPVQTYGIWSFGPVEFSRDTSTISRGISADALGRVFACFGTTFPPHTFKAFCCDHGRIVPVPLRLGHNDDIQPQSVSVSPDGEWLYVLDNEGGIWRLAARRTGEWGEPQLVLRPSRPAAEVRDVVLHDQSMLCTGDALYFWRHDLCFMCVPLTATGAGEPRVVHSAECEGIRWWMLAPGENALLYKGSTTDGTRVDLSTGEETPLEAPCSSISPVCGWSITEDGTWVGTSDALEISDNENAMFTFKGFTLPLRRSAMPLIGGGTDLEHNIIHDAMAPGEPSTVGHVRHAVVDAEGQLWLMDTRFHVVDGEQYEDEVSSIALRCVRPCKDAPPFVLHPKC